MKHPPARENFGLPMSSGEDLSCTLRLNCPLLRRSGPAKFSKHEKVNASKSLSCFAVLFLQTPETFCGKNGIKIFLDEKMGFTFSFSYINLTLSTGKKKAFARRERLRN
jgi:hypothetical protein